MSSVGYRGDEGADQVLLGVQVSTERRHWYRTSGVIAARWIVSLLAVLLAVSCLTAALFSNWITKNVADTAQVARTLAPVASSQTLKGVIVLEVGDVVEQYLLENPVTSQAEQWTHGIDDLLEDVPLLSGLADYLGIEDQIDITGALQEATATLAVEARGVAEAQAQHFVDSPSFTQMFAQVLQSVHSQVLAALSSSVPIPGDTLTVTLDLNPIISAVVADLDSPYNLVATLMPVAAQDVPIFQLQDMGQLQGWYRILVGTAPLYFTGAIAAVALALFACPRRWAIPLTGTVGMGLASVYFLTQIPAFATSETVELDPALAPVVIQAWSLLSAPLSGSFQVALIVSVVLATVSAAGALIWTLTRPT